MGYLLYREAADAFFDELSLTYDIYAPKRFPKQGRFSDTDIIRYSKVENLSEIEFVMSHSQRKRFRAEQTSTFSGGPVLRHTVFPQGNYP